MKNIFNCNPSKPIQFLVIPQDCFALNSLEIVKPDLYLYRLLRAEGYDRVIFFESIGKARYRAYSYDNFSVDSFYAFDKFSSLEDASNDKMISDFYSKKANKKKVSLDFSADGFNPGFSSASSDDDSNDPVEPSGLVYGKYPSEKALKNDMNLENASEMILFYNQRIVSNMKQNKFKTAIIIPQSFLDKDNLNLGGGQGQSGLFDGNKAFDDFFVSSVQDDIDNSGNVLIVSATSIKQLSKNVTEQKIFTRLRNDFKKDDTDKSDYDEQFYYYLSNVLNVVKVFNNNACVDEFINVLLRLKLIEQYDEFKELKADKIVALANALYKHFYHRENPRLSFIGTDRYDLGAIRSCYELLKYNPEYREKIVEYSNSLESSILKVCEADSLNLERVTGTPEQKYDLEFEKQKRLKQLKQKFDELKGEEMERVKNQIFAEIDLFQTEVQEYENSDEESREDIPYMNMIFAGPPGTGKTTVGKLTAQLLYAKGIVKRNTFYASDASKLKKSAIDGTAEEIIKKLTPHLGGVIMIDEFYSFYSEIKDSDNKGTEAVDAIMSLINDHRNDTCFIVCGYKDKVLNTLNLNEGGARRFPHIIYFDAYSVESLMTIFENKISKQKFTLDDEARQAVLSVIDSEKALNGETFGNAGSVESIIQSIKVEINKRGALKDKIITKQDIVNAFPKYAASLGQTDCFDAIYAKFDRLKGKEMERVKEQIFAEIDLFQVEIQEYENSDEESREDIPYMNMIFAGPPGTGKTTVGKLTAQLLYAKGIVKRNTFYASDASKLKKSAIDATAEKIIKELTPHLGGVIMIDEFYSFYSDIKDSDNKGTEAVDAIMSLINDHMNDTCFIICGYKDKVLKTLNLNEGGARRFPHIIYFDAYSVESLMTIFENKISKQKFTLDDDVRQAVEGAIDSEKAIKGETFGNAGSIESIIHAIKVEINKRGALKDKIITKQDVLNAFPEYAAGLGQTYGVDEILAKFDELKGEEMKAVKKQLMGIIKRFEQNVEKFKKSKSDDDIPYMNMIFSGPPGTGKSTVGKLIAKLLCAKGIVKKDSFTQFDASECMMANVGASAEALRDKLNQNIGGVIMIDEFYGFWHPYSEGNVAEETVNEVMNFINRHRNDTILILGGYEKEVLKTLDINSGGARRFPYVLKFNKYSTESLMEIFDVCLAKEEMTITKAAYECVKQVIELSKATEGKKFGNVGFIKDILVEKIIIKYSERLVDDNQIISQDVLNAFPEYAPKIHIELDKNEELAQGHKDDLVGIEPNFSGGNIDSQSAEFDKEIEFNDVVKDREIEHDGLRIDRELINICSKNDVKVSSEPSKLKKSLFIIKAFDDKGNVINNGSGFAVGEDGYILTCYHVIKNAATIECVSSQDKHYEAELVIGRDERNLDLVLLKIEQSIKPLLISNESPNQYGIERKVKIPGYPIFGIANEDNKGYCCTKTEIISEVNDDSLNIKKWSIKDNMDIGISGAPAIDEISGCVIGWVPGAYEQIKLDKKSKADDSKIAFIRPIKLFIDDFLKK